MKRIAILLGLFLLIIVLSTGVIFAATHAPDNTTPNHTGNSNDNPEWLNSGWRFWASTDTAYGEVICVEVHPQGDAGNYVRQECAYLQDLGGGEYEYQCDIFTDDVPAAFQSTTVEYQFFVDWDSNDCSQGNNFSGFNWNFNTSPNAVSLQAMHAAMPTFVWSSLAALLAGGLGAAFWARRKR